MASMSIGQQALRSRTELQFLPLLRRARDCRSMSFDGDFVSNRRIVLHIDGERREWFASISKLGGYLWDKELHGFHALMDVAER